MGLLNKKNSRFEKTVSEDSFAVYRDKKTGVSYLTHYDKYGTGITLLVDRDGKPLIEE